jgi:hypothetical protein
VDYGSRIVEENRLKAVGFSLRLPMSWESHGRLTDQRNRAIVALRRRNGGGGIRMGVRQRIKRDNFKGQPATGAWAVRETGAFCDGNDEPLVFGNHESLPMCIRRAKRSRRRGRSSDIKRIV